MAEGSVDSYINAQPEQAMSWNDYWKENNLLGTQGSPDSFMGHIYNFFTGGVSDLKSKYETYVQNLNNRNEFLAQQSARAWDKMMDDTKYQRMMKDFEAAGLNPYLLVNNGGVSASGSGSSAKASYSSSFKQELKDNSGRNLALVLLAVARIAAALL